MKIYFKLLVLCLGLFVYVSAANAQAHVSKSEYARYNCRLAPKGSNNAEGKLTCPACAKENEDAKTKKIADDKIKTEAGKRKNTADSIAKVKAFQQKKVEKQGTNVTIEAGLTVAATQSAASMDEARKYKVIYPVNRNTSVEVAQSYKVTYNGKVIFETSEFNYVNQVTNRVLFVGDYPESNDCKGDHANLSVLLDKNGKQLTIGGITKFGYHAGTGWGSDEFELVVYDGGCEKVDGKNEGDDHSKWTTIRYRFSYTTMKLVSTEKGGQYDKCYCN